MNKIYLSVPFSEKDEAKSCGAKWDWNEKRWYCTDMKGFEKWKEDTRPIIFRNEDLSPVILSIDMIPQTQWHKNVRSAVSESDWDRLRRFVYKRAEYKCEICGAENEKLDAHELWKFDPVKGTQILIRIIGLCKKCHQSIHFALSIIQGLEKETKEHLCRIRGFDEEQFQQHHKTQHDVWVRLSQREW